MELHLHLTVAFRALDKKWGEAVDLDSTEESLSYPCLPAVVDRPSTTFSSEEFLRRRMRQTPYSRYQGTRRRENVKGSNDSFADISSSRIPNATSIDSGLDQELTVTKLVEQSDKISKVSCDSLDSVLNTKDKCLKKWKNSAKGFIEKRCRKKVAS